MNHKIALILLLLLIPTLVMAQQTSQSATRPLQQTMTDCSGTSSVTLPLTFANVASAGKITYTTPPLPNPNQLADQCPQSITQGALGNNSVTLSPGTTTITLPQSVLIGTEICANPNSAPTYQSLCIYGPQNTYVQQFNYKVDTSNSPITITSVTGGNKRITVNIKDNKDLKNYLVCYGKVEADVKALVTSNSTTCGSQGGTTLTSTTGDIVNLENDVAYYVIARVNSGSTTQAPWSGDPLSATPRPTDSYTDVYDGVPSPFSISCSQSSGAPATWVLLLGVLLMTRSRRRRGHPWIASAPKRFAMTMFLAMFAFGATAESGQINLGFTGVVYKPSLNSSTKADGSAITTPFYRCMYNDKLIPLMGVDLDWHLTDAFGSLQLGFGVAYTYAGGFALNETNGQPDCSSLSGDSVSMHLVHLKLPQLTYVLDAGVDSFPLVPYIRAGVQGMGYLFNYQGSLDRENMERNKPIGMVFGWEAAAGLMLSLNFLEPKVAQAAIGNGLYNQVYLKVEAAYNPINNFGSNGLNFSPAWPTTSFPLMLRFGLVFELQ